MGGLGVVGTFCDSKMEHNLSTLAKRSPPRESEVTLSLAENQGEVKHLHKCNIVQKHAKTSQTRRTKLKVELAGRHKELETNHEEEKHM